MKRLADLETMNKTRRALGNDLLERMREEAENARHDALRAIRLAKMAERAQASK